MRPRLRSRWLVVVLMALLPFAPGCNKSRTQAQSDDTAAPAAAVGKSADCGSPQECFDWGEAARLAQPTDLTTAAAHYEAACTGGHLQGCSALALQLQDGRGAPRDVPRAMELYRKACDGGAGIGCFNLGLLHFAGTEPGADPGQADAHFRRAEAAYRKSCDAGELVWCMNLGVLYEGGYGVDKDAGKAAGIYRDACDKGHGDACANLALLELDGVGVMPDPAAAAKRLDQACTGGSAVACGALGQLLAFGNDYVPADKDRGAVALEKGCAGGSAPACSTLGALLATGELGPADPERAEPFIDRGCALGQSVACLLLANVKLREHDDDTAAARYYEAACNIGDGEACGLLSTMVEAGEGVPADPARAQSLLDRSCAAGYPGGCVELLQRNRPLPLPEERKQMFLAAACERGVARACELKAP